MQMMSTNNESSTMENCTTLRDLAEFDINAPFSVTISFDDDSSDEIVKKEILTDNVEENEVDEENIVSAFFPTLESEEHIPPRILHTYSPVFNTELKLSDDCTGQNSYRDGLTTKPDNQKDKLLNSSTPKKRKVENFEIKRKLKQSDTVTDHTSNENGYKENFLATPTNDKIKDSIESNLSLSSGGFENNNSGATTNKKATEKHFNLSSYLEGVDQTKHNKIRSCILDHLSSLSETMCHIMQAFGAYKQKHISYEQLQKYKRNSFNLSHKTLVTIMLPEKNNNDFLIAFIKKTLQAAREKCDPYYSPTYQDFANLLEEMLMWAKVTQPVQSAEESEQSVIQSRTVGTKINKDVTQNNLLLNNVNQNTESDKICIFSSGPPERAISINIDSNLKKHFQNISQDNCNVTNHLIETKQNKLQNFVKNTATDNVTTTFKTNNIPSSTIPHRPLVIQSTASLISNTASTPIERHSTIPSSTQRCSTSNVSNDIIRNHLKAPAPVLQSQLRKQSPGHLQQQVQSPLYELSLKFGTQSKQQQVTHSHAKDYDHSQLLPAQPVQQKQMPSQYKQAQLLQPQLNTSQFPQFQYLHTQSGSQYGTSLPLQGQLGQSAIPMTQYNQQRQSQVVILQQNHQLDQNQNDSWPTMEELLSVECTPQLPYQSSNEQCRSSGQWRSSVPHQAQPLQTYSTEWHQGQVYQAQIPPQAQKGPPRTASTDSGFISPLHFNMSTDQTRLEQTMPMTPHEPGTSLPTIVHVTSLSEKAAFIKIGKCVVCNKSTKQMCMGCMKTYYCNYLCQSQDWDTHAPYCSKRNTNYR